MQELLVTIIHSFFPTCCGCHILISWNIVISCNNCAIFKYDVVYKLNFNYIWFSCCWVESNRKFRCYYCFVRSNKTWFKLRCNISFFVVTANISSWLKLVIVTRKLNKLSIRDICTVKTCAVICKWNCIAAIAACCCLHRRCSKACWSSLKLLSSDWSDSFRNERVTCWKSKENTPHYWIAILVSITLGAVCTITGEFNKVANSLLDCTDVSTAGTCKSANLK